MPCNELLQSKTAAVVLAAGFSRRLGRPKQQIVLGGETLLQHAIRVAAEAGLVPVFVVTRVAEVSSTFPPEVRLIENRDAAEGMAASVRHGILAAQQAGATGAVLLTCDQPLLTAAHLQALCAQPDQITASGYSGRAAVPAYFPASAFEALLQLRGDEGARTLLRGAATIQNETLALDIDTGEDLQRALEQFARR